MFEPAPGKRGRKGLPNALHEERVQGDVQLIVLRLYDTMDDPSVCMQILVYVYVYVQFRWTDRCRHRYVCNLYIYIQVDRQIGRQVDR